MSIWKSIGYGEYANVFPKHSFGQWDVSQCHAGVQRDQASERIQAVQQALKAAEAAASTHDQITKLENAKQELFTYIENNSAPKDFRWPCPWGDPAPLAVEWKRFADEFTKLYNEFSAHSTGDWKCSGNPPPPEADYYYHCCPSGWKQVLYGSTSPCEGEAKQFRVCGPLPTGMPLDAAVCCEPLREWVAGGAGVCQEKIQSIAASGTRAIPGMTETMLTRDVITIPDKELDASLFTKLSMVVIPVIGLTVIAKFIWGSK